MTENTSYCSGKVSYSKDTVTFTTTGTLKYEWSYQDSSSGTKTYLNASATYYDFDISDISNIFDDTYKITLKVFGDEGAGKGTKNIILSNCPVDISADMIKNTIDC